MLITLQDAKNRYHFRLVNFCVMPTHIHLLLEPKIGTKLSEIMQWIKTRSARRWNSIHGSIDHFWGERFFAKPVKDPQEFDFVMNYIDQNPVTVGLAETPAAWKASGAYYRERNIPGLIDFGTDEEQQVKLISPIPMIVSRLLPPAQHDKIIKHFGAYAESIDKL